MQMEMKKKTSQVAILIYDKTDFKSKPIVKDKEEHNTMIKGKTPTRGYNPSKHL